MSDLVAIGDLNKPEWLKVKVPQGPGVDAVVRVAQECEVSTVCVSARCPNQAECWSLRTATFMIMGECCTRACRFCHVKHARTPSPLRADEPRRVAAAVAALNIEHAVITSVDRDDLVDGGAAHFGACVRELHLQDTSLVVEVLAPDFGGCAEHLSLLLDAEPDVFGHNLETTEALTPTVRDSRASYRRSLQTLWAAKRLSPDVLTKSGLMLGLGESDDDVVATLRELRGVGVDLVTLGQYLRPSARHLPVVRYVAPAGFEALATVAREMGFVGVYAGALVRSSYRAAGLYQQALRAIAGRGSM